MIHHGEPQDFHRQVESNHFTRWPHLSLRACSWLRKSSSARMASTTPAQGPPRLSGSMNWEPVQKRLLSTDLNEALKATMELRENIEIVHSTEFPLMLSALLPAFSSVLAHRTRPSPDVTSVEHKLRNTILDIISKMPSNEVLRPHAPHLVALAMDILNRDYEENALLASRIIFDLYKVYRSLPQDYVQPYLDFVVSSYRALSAAIQRNFTLPPPSVTKTETPVSSAVSDSSTAASATGESGAAPGETPTSLPTDPLSANKEETQEKSSTPTTTDTVGTPKMEEGDLTVATGTASAKTSPASEALAVRSNMSFRVLTESPLIVMLMLQLYPSFMKTNIPVLINVMMEALSLRSPPIQSILPAGQSKPDSTSKRLYFSKSRNLVAAQAKTLSFVTYLLRSFSPQLKPYEDRLATNVVSLMTTCPRESIGTRKELLVATRHLLNSDFRKGFFRHVDSLLDERVLMGTHHRFSDQALLRPLGYTTLSDLVQHVRSLLSMTQMKKVVCTFSRVLHDSSLTLPMSTQYTAVRTLLNVVDIIYHNKDPNPQLGRDLLVQTLSTLVDKLESLVDSFPAVKREEILREQDAADSREEGNSSSTPDERKSPSMAALAGTPPDAVRDLQIMIRAIIVGHKSIIYYINSYRTQREKDAATWPERVRLAGMNEEVMSAMGRISHTEAAIIDKYILTALPAAKLLKEKGTSGVPAFRPGGEKPLAEQHRDALTYFAASFTALDGVTLARTLGKRVDLLVDAIVDDPIVMVVPRHLLGANPTVSFEFCSLLLDNLMGRMDQLAFPRDDNVVFFDPPSGRDMDEKKAIQNQIVRLTQRPMESKERVRQRSTTLLQLFERVLKSLSVFADNEATVRRHLRRIVVDCLRSSMEETNMWPDNYCMLLRYVFRSISAGKFEDSYKELLPIIPTVLNGLYRVISTSKDEVLRHTAVELCLTIPARLSSLLPHMNLLLRVIIPALDSGSGDLVNLG